MGDQLFSVNIVTFIVINLSSYWCCAHELLSQTSDKLFFITYTSLYMASHLTRATLKITIITDFRQTFFSLHILLYIWLHIKLMQP